jgi:carbon-monoxide dehydrogenase small subunit
MVLAAVDLLERNPHPSDADIRNGLAGNLCRCTGYMKIFESVVRACQKRT